MKAATRTATEIAVKTGTNLAKAGCKVLQMKSTFDAAKQEPMVAMKRALRKARYTAEDFSDQLVLDIRKQPLKALSITFGIAFGIGAAAGWLVKRA